MKDPQFKIGYFGSGTSSRLLIFLPAVLLAAVLLAGLVHADSHSLSSPPSLSDAFHPLDSPGPFLKEFQPKSIKISFLGSLFPSYFPFPSPFPSSLSSSPLSLPFLSSIKDFLAVSHPPTSFAFPPPYFGKEQIQIEGISNEETPFSANIPSDSLPCGLRSSSRSSPSSPSLLSSPSKPFIPSASSPSLLKALDSLIFKEDEEFKRHELSHAEYPPRPITSLDDIDDFSASEDDDTLWLDYIENAVRAGILDPPLRLRRRDKNPKGDIQITFNDFEDDLDPSVSPTELSPFHNVISDTNPKVINPNSDAIAVQEAKQDLFDAIEDSDLLREFELADLEATYDIFQGVKTDELVEGTSEEIVGAEEKAEKKEEEKDEGGEKEGDKENEKEKEEEATKEKEKKKEIEEIEKSIETSEGENGNEQVYPSRRLLDDSAADATTTTTSIINDGSTNDGSTNSGSINEDSTTTSTTTDAVTSEAGPTNNLAQLTTAGNLPNFPTLPNGDPLPSFNATEAARHLPSRIWIPGIVNVKVDPDTGNVNVRVGPGGSIYRQTEIGSGENRTGSHSVFNGLVARVNVDQNNGTQQSHVTVGPAGSLVRQSTTVTPSASNTADDSNTANSSVDASTTTAPNFRSSVGSVVGGNDGTTTTASTANTQGPPIITTHVGVMNGLMARVDTDSASRTNDISVGPAGTLYRYHSNGVVSRLSNDTDTGDNNGNI